MIDNVLHNNSFINNQLKNNNNKFTKHEHELRINDESIKQKERESERE